MARVSKFRKKKYYLKKRFVRRRVAGKGKFKIKKRKLERNPRGVKVHVGVPENEQEVKKPYKPLTYSMTPYKKVTAMPTGRKVAGFGAALGAAISAYAGGIGNPKY